MGHDSTHKLMCCNFSIFENLNESQIVLCNQFQLQTDAFLTTVIVIVLTFSFFQKKKKNKKNLVIYFCAAF